MTTLPELVIGVDEVGYGAWAGPLYVCAFALPKSFKQQDMAQLNDSKKMTPASRRRVFDQLVHMFPNAYCFVSTPAPDIDAVGVGRANFIAIEKAVDNLLDIIGRPCEVIIDGSAVFLENCQTVPKADTIHPSVMAASVVAKHLRDTYMVELSRKIPGYGFEKHMGYGTQQHREALKHLGSCIEHRMSYAPLKNLTF